MQNLEGGAVDDIIEERDTLCESLCIREHKVMEKDISNRTTAQIGHFVLEFQHGKRDDITGAILLFSFLECLQEGKLRTKELSPLNTWPGIEEEIDVMAYLFCPEYANQPKFLTFSGRGKQVAKPGNKCSSFLPSQIRIPIHRSRQRTKIYKIYHFKVKNAKKEF